MKQLLAFISIAVILISCSGNSSPAAPAVDPGTAAIVAKDSVTERNKATALASVEAFGSGKMDDAFKDAAPDVVDYGDGSMKPMKGLDSIKYFVKQYMAAFPDYKGANFIVVGDGIHVAVFGDYTGTFKNPLMGMKPTGKSFKVKDVDLFTFNDAGKIIEHRSVQSNNTMMEMVGAKMKK
jgi:predicted ester cyclase